MARDLAAEMQRSGGVGGREYLSGRHSNTVSINVPGHLLNQATAARLDDVQLSPSSNGHSMQRRHQKQPQREKTTAKQRFDPSIRSAHDGSCHHVAAGESSAVLGENTMS